MRKLSLLLVLMLFSAAQLLAQRTITGTVLGDDGKTLPSVTVLVNGDFKQAAQTDLDGKYSIKAPTNAKFLRFSFVGMRTQDVQITSSNVINITLESEASQLEGVVVTGYVTRGKNQITGSTVQVKSSDLKNNATVSVDQALQGKVAGLAISASSGTPGSVQDIRIRGVGSLTASNDPLIVIDGVPIINPNLSGSSASSSLSALSAINNDDIESLTVLKDASATAAYGARGSNGVIVITTKKGKAGKTNFNLSTYYGFQNRAIDGRKQLNGAQREELFLESLVNSGETDKEHALEYALSPDGWDMQDLKAWIADGRPNNDWNDVMLHKNAPLFNAQLSAQGGTEDANFYASLGYNKTQSIIVGADFKRVNGSLNYTRKFTNKVKFSTTNSVSNVRQNGLLLEQGAYFGNPIMGRYFISPWFAPYTKDGEPNREIGNVFNWLYTKDHNETYNDYTRIISNNFIEWEFYKNFKFKSLVALDYGITNYKDYRNRLYGDGLDKNGTSDESIARNFVSVFQNSINYTNTFGDHYISALGLIEYQKSKYHYLYGYGENFITDGVTNINSAASNWKADSQFEDWKNASYLGMVNYTFASKYIADVTFRREGSSRFAENNRFGNFWSIGLAWNISGEDFMKPYKEVISNLRLRTSYGRSGNSGIGLNSYQALLGFDANYAGMGAVYPTGYGNDKLTWEKNNTFDIGMDYGLWDNRVNGSFAYFNKKTTDLLQSVPIPSTTGFTSVARNVGSILNRGFEAIINVEAVKTNDFKLTVNFNIATLHNEILKLAKDPQGKDLEIDDSYSNKMSVGHPYGEWYIRSWAGVNPDNGKPQWYVDKTKGDEITNDYYAAQRTFQGSSPIPKYTGGFGFNADYKGIYLNTNFYFAGGNTVFEDWSRYTFHDGYFATAVYNGVEDLMKRWQKPGDITDVPIILATGNGNNASRISSRFLYKGDYIRLKDITLGYNFSKQILNKIHYPGTISVFAKGTNLLTWVKDKNMKYDPEVRADGFTRFTNPPVKSIIFGINLNF